MKKVITLATAALVLLFATACSKNEVVDSDEMNYKIGMSSYTVTDKSSPSTANGNGKGVVSTVYLSAIFDDKNVIKRINIDEVETSIYFDTAGQLVPSTTGEFKSKRELGDAYNMKPASAIGKEWNEQIDSLEKYLEGKVVTDIIAGVDGVATRQGTYQRNTDFNATGDSMTGVTGTGEVLGADSVPGDSVGSDGTVVDGTASTPDSVGGTGTSMWQEDLKSSVTIDLTTIQMALKKAYENAR